MILIISLDLREFGVGSLAEPPAVGVTAAQEGLASQGTSRGICCFCIWDLRARESQESTPLTCRVVTLHVQDTQRQFFKAAIL